MALLCMHASNASQTYADVVLTVAFLEQFPYLYMSHYHDHEHNMRCIPNAGNET